MERSQTDEAGVRQNGVTGSSMTAEMAQSDLDQTLPGLRRRTPGFGLPFFTALFAALIVADLTVVGVLIFRDLSRQVVSEALLRSRQQAESIARQLVPEVPAGGPANLSCVVRTTTTLARYIEGALEDFAALQEIAIVNEQGTPVQVFYRRTDMRRRTPEDGLGAPGVLRAGGASSREFPASGPDGYNIPETDRKVLERLGVPIPAGRLPPGEPRNVVQVRQSQNVQRPRLPDYDVRVPVQLGAGRAGSVNMLLSHGELEREIENVRRSLVLKVLMGAAASVVLIVLAYFVVLRLLSRTRQVEAETQAADRLSYVGMLAAGLAHEIRNPLSAMKMNLQMVEQELEPGPDSGSGEGGAAGGRGGATAASAEVRELLRESSLQIDRLNDLVTQFLSYARPARLELRPADLNRVVRETVHFLQAEADTRNVRTDLALDPQLPPVPLDETQVRQALLNIYRNAFEALDSRGGGTVRAQTSAANGGPIRLVIEDDGPGVPADRRERIFTAFFSSKPGGTGLGLPVVQRIVEGHGGSIAVESAPGSGARFILSFPLAHAVRAT